MKELFSLPWHTPTVEEYPDLREACRTVGCDGVELVWGGEENPPEVPGELTLGYHLTFWPDWLDFWNNDRAALERKFGAQQVWEEFYGGSDGRETLLAGYRADLKRALAKEPEYLVFHVSDVSLEEGYTYRWEHTDEQIIDAAGEVLTELLRDGDLPCPVFVENQWWAGFTFTDPAKTERLLSAIPTEKKGILLDIGHMMNACTDIETQAQGAEFVLECYRRHGELGRYVKAFHLHQSISGDYVKANTGFLPKDWEEQGDYVARFMASYGHILQIDRHQPWTDPAVRDLLETIAPEYVTHELSAVNRAAREAAILTQRAAMGQ